MTDRAGRGPGADETLGADDQHVLAVLARAWDQHDPVPSGLVDTVAFTVGCHEVAVEVAAILGGAPPVASPVGATRSGASGGDGSDDDVRTLTFTTTRRTIMVQVTRTGSGRQRLDGWVEPVVVGAVRLQVGASTRDATVSAAGRFQFADLPPATMRLLLLDDGVPTTVTPAFEW